MEKLISGDISESSMDQLRELHPKKKQMIFVSSTFLDTNLERDILHRKILPHLIKKAQQHEIQVIFYDMRFGVKDENTLDHKTWVACKEAIQQCYEGSDGLFFLSLQADRYGYLPLPKYLDEAVLSKARQDHETDPNFNDITKYLTEWYKRDENHSPPRYELKRLATLRDPDFNVAVPVLKNCLLDSVTFETLKSLPEEIVVNRSVTQWETYYALDCDKERCYWIQRLFNEDLLRAFKDNADCWKLTDIFEEKDSPAEKLALLHTKMKSYLREDQRHELLSYLSPATYLKNEGCKEYLQRWEKVTCDCLENDLEKVILKCKEWNIGFRGIPVDHLEEIIHHCSTAFNKALTFYGREELLQSALQGIKKNKKDGGKEEAKETKHRFSSISLAIVGKSGCGKTALMSKLFLSYIAEQSIPMIIRFCGTSKFSLTGLKLIQSISLQIIAIYQKREEIERLIPLLPLQDYKKAVEYFHRLISTYPVILFIDSLDQLENQNEERSKLTFLRDIKAHEQSRIIVSTLPDEYDEDGKPEKYFFQCERTLEADQVPIQVVGLMEDIESTIKQLLLSRHRQLAPDQWTVVLKSVAHEPTILYINLAMEIVSQWRSFENDVKLTPTEKGLIHQIFEGFEKDYGRQFTAIAFSMITFSREGVNDNELQDLLSLHEGVMTEVCQYSQIYCFPMHAWLRLKFVINNLVTEKEDHCIKWYHRQLWETASERYSVQEQECHEIMGKYFSNLYDATIRIEKDILDQPLTLNGMSIWQADSIVNRRRVMEGYYHLIKAGLFSEAIHEICSLEFICCSALAGDLLSCVCQVGDILLSFGDSSTNVPERLNHYYRWARKKATMIIPSPRLQVRVTAGEEPVVSIVNKDAQELFERERKTIGYTFGPVAFGSAMEFDALELDVIASSDGVTSVAWNHDSSKLLTGSADKTAKIWDANTGTLLKTLEGHTAAVNSVTWNHNGTKVATSSRDKTVRIWNEVSGEMWKTLDLSPDSFASTIQGYLREDKGSNSKIREEEGPVTMAMDEFEAENARSWYGAPLAWNHVDNKLAVGSWDDVIKFWDGESGELLQTLKGHSLIVTSLAWSPDGSRLVSGSWDRTINIWDAVSGEILKTLNVADSFTGKAVVVSWHPQEKNLIVFGCGKEVGTWDFLSDTSSAHFATYDYRKDAYYGAKYHWGNVLTCVNCSRDGRKIVSAAGSENTVKIWERTTGTLLTTLEGNATYNGTAYSLEISHDDRKIVGGFNDGTMKIWNLMSDVVTPLKNTSGRGTSFVAWSPDGTLLLSNGTADDTMVWNGETGILVKSLHADWNSSSPTAVAWNQDGSKIASASKEITVWDVATGQALQTLEVSGVEENPEYKCVTWSPDDSILAAGAADGSIGIWDAMTFNLLKILRFHERPVRLVAWQPDGSRLASVSDRELIKIWKCDSYETTKTGFVKKLLNSILGESFETLSGHNNNNMSISALTWSRDGTKLFSCSPITIWDGVKGEVLKTLNDLHFLSAAWNYDCSKAVVINNNKGNSYSGVRDDQRSMVLVWDMETGKEISSLGPFVGEHMQSVAWNQEGYIALGNNRNLVRKWFHV
jgi:WD40 repeat protein